MKQGLEEAPYTSSYRFWEGVTSQVIRTRAVMGQ